MRGIILKKHTHSETCTVCDSVSSPVQNFNIKEGCVQTEEHTDAIIEFRLGLGRTETDELNKHGRLPARVIK